MKQLISASMLVVLLSGCSVAQMRDSGAFDKPTAATDFGASPSTLQAEAAATRFLSKRFKDPHYHLSAPRKAYTSDGALRGGKIIAAGYAVQVKVDTNDRYGPLYTLVLHNGKLADAFLGTGEDAAWFHILGE